MKLFSSILSILLMSPICFGQITVQGEGVVTAEPDIASVVVAVSNQNKKASEAMKQTNEAMNAIFDRLLNDFKLDKKDLCTTSFMLLPEYEYVKDKSPIQIGYSATNQLLIKVKDLSKLGSLLDYVVLDGANRVGGIQFYITNSNELVDQARDLAIKDAVRKANLYAKGLGVKVGKVVTVSELERYAPQYSMAESAAAPGGARKTPTAAGEKQFRISVSVVFEVLQ
jgi:uncharacterized protein